MPSRIQRKRTKGWRMPEGAVSVTRPGPFGNPFPVGYLMRLCDKFNEPCPEFDRHGYGSWVQIDASLAVVLFEKWSKEQGFDWSNLAGKDLACWCRLCSAHAAGKPFGVRCDDCAPCHADVLGQIANGLTCEAVDG